MGEIRTELGSTYGVSAFRRGSVGPSAYLVMGGIQSERTGETIKAMRVKVDELRQGIEFDGAFALARRDVLKDLLAESTVSGALAGRLASIAIYGQNPDYYDKLTRYVATLSPAQVKALIATELKPENEVIGLLGDKEALEKAFTEAGIDNVKYVDVSE
jgi:predicted Zn-dependent peptidase